jgi:thiol-disulfide isomerase/thioredoxin
MNTKIIGLYLSLVYMIVLSATAVAGNCHITVKLNGCKADSAKVMLVNFLDPEHILNQKIAIKNGAVVFNTSIDDVRLVVISFDNNDRATCPAMVRAHVIPDCSLTINVTSKDFTIGGSPAYESINKARKAVGNYNAAAPKSGYETLVLNYVKAHPSEIGAGYVASDLWESITEADKLLSKAVKDKLHGYYDYFYNKRTAPARIKKNAEKSAEGKIAPDFTLKDINGNDFKLSSLRGKTVVLDFWGSWCNPCIKSMPRMKQYYDKYKGHNFVVVSVNCSDTDVKWRNAVKANSMTWTNVFNPSADNENNVSSKYGISAFPTMLIISPEGKILKKSIGEEDGFFTMIDELMNNK